MAPPQRGLITAASSNLPGLFQACWHAAEERIRMNPEVGLALFLAGIAALSCALLGGLYLLIRHEPMPF